MSRAARLRREWIPVGEATRLLGVSPATLRRWADAGRLTVFTTPGGHRRFERSAVLALLPRVAPRSTPRNRPVRPHAARPARPTPLRANEELVLAALRGYLATPAGLRTRALREARRTVAAYGSATSAAGLSTAEAVAAFQRLRARLLREITSSTCGAAPDGVTAAELLMAAVEGCDRLLEACISGHECGSAEAAVPRVARRLAG